MITIFKNIKQTTAGYHRPIEEILERIKSGVSKEQVEKIRSAKNKEDHRLLKNDLPSICFSGTFNQRSDDGIIEHSGYICLDFDKFPDDKSLKESRDKLTKDNYTYSLFTSPSGNGLKVLVKIPKDPENHKAYFSALMNYYDSPHFDISCSNLSRVCYESYDPKIFINKDSELWTEKEDNPHYDIGTITPILQMKNENRIIQNLLAWFNKKFDLSEGNRNSNLFKLASAFNDFGVGKLEAESVMRQFAQKDFTEREIEQVVNSAYKNTSNHGTKFFEDNELKGKIQQSIRSGKSSKEIKKLLPNYSTDEVDTLINDVKDELAVTEFWRYTKQGKVTLVPHKYREFLEQHNFYKLYPNNSESFVFIHKSQSFIEQSDPVLIKDFILNWLYNYKDSIQPYDFMASATKYFKEDYLTFLSSADLHFQQDTKDTCYIYYQNYALEINKDTVNLIDYLKLDGFVWKKHVIHRDFKLLKSDNGCVFKRFIELIAGDDDSRYYSLVSVIGYLLHSHKTSANNKCIILNDEMISENPNGGSGKGIFCQGLAQIKRMATLDGKRFDPDKSFAYQTVGADTQVLLFDDVKKNFNFESLFSLVTEGITLEKKNKDAIHLRVDKSPKIIITTNYTIGGVGGSHERRKFEVEFSAHFNANHTPLDEFGHMMFDEWDEDEWHRFDYFMIFCIQYYLKNGLQAHQYQNLHVRKYIKETSFEFYEWADDTNLPMDELLYKSDMFESFISEFPDYKKYLTQKRFSNWIESYVKHNNYILEKGKNNGIRWIKITKGTGDKGQ